MKVIHHVVDVNVPASTLWSAITDEGGPAGWWTAHVKAPAATLGSRIEFTFMEGFNPVMEIVRAEPDVELEWRCAGGHAVELSDDADGTYNFNWGYYLNSLPALCATGTGLPFDPSDTD